MKKLFVLGLGSLFALGANAQSLEERVEALEFQGYENYFKMSGQLEMRYDVVDRTTKDAYEVISDTTKYVKTKLGAKVLTAGVTAGAGAGAGALYKSMADGLDCGEGLTGAAFNTAAGASILATDGSNDIVNDGCTGFAKDQKDNATLGQVFLRLNMESKPSDRLSFYGRLSMSKYMTATSETKNADGTSTAGGTGDNFYDLRSGVTQRDAQVWVERAFVNYKLSNSGVFTFGRLPTITGAPHHLKTSESMKGNYPLAAFAGEFDGMAYTHGFAGGHTLRFVYAPFQVINYADPIKGDSNAESKVDSWTAMYELERSYSWTRKLHMILMHSSFKGFALAGTDLTQDTERSSLYAEMIGIAGSRFDFAISLMNVTTKSNGYLADVSKSGLNHTIGGWLTETDDDSSNGSAYGFTLRYGVSNTAKVGYEYYLNEKTALAYDSGNNEAVSIYANYGVGQRIFFVKDFDGGLKWQVDYTMIQTDYAGQISNLIGKQMEVDNQTNVLATRFIANF